MKRSKYVMFTVKQPYISEEELTLLGNWAYIKHTDGENGEHWHYLIEADNLLPLSTYADKLQIPVNQVRAMSNIRASARYLLHLDSPNKERYKREDITTNNNAWYDARIEDFYARSDKNVQMLYNIENLPYRTAVFYLLGEGLTPYQVVTFIKLKEYVKLDLTKKEN